MHRLLVLVAFVLVAVPIAHAAGESGSVKAASPAQLAPDDYSVKLQLAIWGAVSGGVVSLIVNLFLQSFMPWIKRWRLTRCINVYPEVTHGEHTRCRVYNGGYWTMGNAIAYITLNVGRDDVIQPPRGQDAFIRPDQFVPLESQQLCWSVRSPSANPLKVDIFAKERQPLAPCALGPDFIVIPSEEGWVFPTDRPRIARVFLRRKKYDGVLKIVSADTDARFFRLEIDPGDPESPLRIIPMTKRQAREQAPQA